MSRILDVNFIKPISRDTRKVLKEWIVLSDDVSLENGVQGASAGWGGYINTRPSEILN